MKEVRRTDLIEQVSNAGLIEQVGLVPGDRFGAFGPPPGGMDLVPPFEQGGEGMAADEPRPSCDQDSLHYPDSREAA